MNRDYTNEIIAAIAAVALLAFAVTFSILLAVVDNESRAESGTIVAVVPSEPGTGVDTNVDAVVEPTATRTPRPTNTEEPTGTDEPTATRTLRPTNTEEPTTTHTPRPTNTEEPTGTDEPTATRTPRPTNTEEPTETDEPTATRTPRPTNTPEPTTTNALILEENQTLGIIVTPTPCVGRTDWVVYRVHPIDTLEGIAESVGTTVDVLLDGNCLLDAESFEAGLELHVPRLPEWIPIGCLSSSVIIESPVPGEQITVNFAVVGTVNVADQSFYRLEIRPDDAIVYQTLVRSREVVVGGVLGEVVRDDYDNGLYWLRVVAVDKQASIPSDGVCTIPVRFE